MKTTIYPLNNKYKEFRNFIYFPLLESKLTVKDPAERERHLRHNNIIKNLLQNFDDFDETKQYGIRKIIVKITNSTCTSKSKAVCNLAYPNALQESLEIYNINDLIILLYYLKHYKLFPTPHIIEIESEFEKNSFEEKLLNDFKKYVELLDHEITLRDFFSTTVTSTISKYFNLIPRKIFGFINDKFTDLRNVHPALGAVLVFAFAMMFMVTFPLNLTLGVYGVYRSTQLKKEFIQDLIEAEKSIEGNIIYKKSFEEMIFKRDERDNNQLGEKKSPYHSNKIEEEKVNERKL